MPSTILECHACQSKLDVSRFEPGKKIRCATCKEILVVPGVTGDSNESEYIRMEGGKPMQNRRPPESDAPAPRKPAEKPAAARPSPKTAAKPAPARPARNADDDEEEILERPRSRGAAARQPARSATASRRSARDDNDEEDDEIEERPRRGGRGKSGGNKTPLLIAGVVGIVLLAIAAFLLTRDNDAPSGNGAKKEDDTAKTPAVDPKITFQINYKDKLERARSDTRALYELAHEAKSFELTDQYNTIMKRIVALDPRKTDPFVVGTVLPEMGYKEIAFHERDAESPDYEPVWKEQKGWFSGEELAANLAKEEAYQKYLADPVTIKRKRILEHIGKTLDMKPEMFVVHITEHYAIVIEKAERYSIKEAFADYEAKLEQFYDEYYAFFEPYQSIVAMKPVGRDDDIIFVLLKNRDSYLEHTKAPPFWAGHYDLNSKLLYSFKANPQETETLFHEGTHQLMHFSSAYYTQPGNISIVAPWFNEGIAEFFGSVKRDEETGGFKFGQVNRLRVDIIQTILSSQKDLTLDDILTVSYPTLNKDPMKYSNLIYSAGWAMNYFFMTYSDGVYREDFIRFIRMGLEAKTSADDFWGLFGKYGKDKLNKEWREYTLSLKLR